MKYFSPSYWFKMWLLSTPLFNYKNEGIYAKSIANQNIKDWANKNTNLQLIENQALNLSNNQTIYLPNEEKVPSSKNFETDDFYENFLKTQGWSNNPEIAQKQLIEIQEEHHNFLKQEHKKRQMDDHNARITNIWQPRYIITENSGIFLPIGNDFGFSVILFHLFFNQETNRLPQNNHPLDIELRDFSTSCRSFNVLLNRENRYYFSDARIFNQQELQQLSLSRSPDRIIPTLNNWIRNNHRNNIWTNIHFPINSVNMHNEFFLDSIFSLSTYQNNILEAERIINHVSNTYTRLFARHLYNFCRLSIDNNSPAIFLANINDFPNRFRIDSAYQNLRQDNYFLVTGISDNNDLFPEEINYRIYDNFRLSNTINYEDRHRSYYDISGQEFINIINIRSCLMFNYANSNDQIEFSSFWQYNQFVTDFTHFLYWQYMIENWFLANNPNEQLCDNFDDYINSPNRLKKREIINDACKENPNILDLDLKFSKQNIYYIFSINDYKKFVLTDEGFHLFMINDEIFKIGNFENRVNVIYYDEENFYIMDEFKQIYNIDLPSEKYIKIKTNYIINDYDLENILTEIFSFENNNPKTITALHVIQKNEYNDEAFWEENDILVGTDQGAYLYNHKDRILDKFNNLNINVQNFEVNSNSAYAINQQGQKFDLNLFYDNNSYNPYYKIDNKKDYKLEFDKWGSNNILRIHISYDNVMRILHSFLYNTKNDFVNYLLNDYLNQLLKDSDLFNENERKNIVKAIWNNFSDFHEKSLNINDSKCLVFQIDGDENWSENHMWLEDIIPKRVVVEHHENYNFKPAYEIENEIEDQELQVRGQVWHSNEVIFRISHYNIHQMFKSFTYNLKNDFINNFIDGFLKKLLIKKIGSFLNRDYFYDDYYNGLANTIWNHFGDFHEQALSVKRDQAIYFDMFALSGSLDGTLSIVKDHIHRYNRLCHKEFRSSDEEICNLRSSLVINSKHQLLKSTKIYDDYIHGPHDLNKRELFEDKNITKWTNDFTKSINNEQNLPINNKTNFVSSNITSL